MANGSPESIQMIGNKQNGVMNTIPAGNETQANKVKDGMRIIAMHPHDWRIEIGPINKNQIRRGGQQQIIKQIPQISGMKPTITVNDTIPTPMQAETVMVKQTIEQHKVHQHIVGKKNTPMEQRQVRRMTRIQTTIQNRNIKVSGNMKNKIDRTRKIIDE